MKRFRAFILITLSLLVLPGTCMGQLSLTSDLTLNGVIPYKIAAGESQKGSALIENTSNVPVTAVLYGSDSAPTREGRMTLSPGGAEPKNLGKWISFEKPQIDLAPHQKKEVGFTVQVPELATPGTYGGGIAASLIKKPTEQSGAIGASFRTRNIILMLVTVPGEKTTIFNWIDFNHSEKNGHLFLLSLKNNGNTALTADAELKIDGWPFFESNTVNVDKITLFPYDAPEVPIEWKQKPFFGFFTATAKLTVWELDAASGEKIKPVEYVKTVSFAVIPWKEFTAAGILIAMLLLAFIIVRAREKKAIKNCRPYAVQENETLESIAASCGISWKKLAKWNKIKPPFTIKTGSTILAPPKNSNDKNPGN